MPAGVALPDPVLTVNKNLPLWLISTQHGAVCRSANGERRRGCRLVIGLTYDALTWSFYDRLDYRTVGIIENCPARLRLSAGHRVSVVPQLGAVRAYLCGDFRDRGG